MAKIAIERAPAPAVPRRFLLGSAAWGIAAGALLLIDGDAALQTRWAPATLALVHALTVGLLGNAMAGSLLQFLPAAAGVRVGGGTGAAMLLFASLNLGALLLVAGFRAMHPGVLLPAAALLAVAFVLLAAMVLPGLVRAQGQRLLRAGVGGAALAALATVALGAAMLSGLTGRGGLAVVPWADVHAAWGVLGWLLGLVAAVGGVVMPMFQGTRTPTARAHGWWLGALAAVLATGTAAAAAGARPDALRWGAAACLALFAAGGLWLQWCAPRLRNAWLVRSWRGGFLALLAAGVVLAMQGPAVLAGVLVLGIGLPWLVAGMQLEIVAFLGWIELHRRHGRGLRQPSVQALVTDREKGGVFTAQALAAWALLFAAAWPTPLGARAAGFALAGAHAVLWWRLSGVGRRVCAFPAGPGRTVPAADPHAH